MALVRPASIDGRNLNELEMGRGNLNESGPLLTEVLEPRAVRALPIAAAGPSPFHCSARVTFGPSLVKPPTAVQTDNVGHETAGGSTSYAPGRFGVLWTLHWVPAQRSATVNGAGVKASPVAVHADGEEHDTPLKKSPFPSVPDGVTADCTVHAVPSHRSASSPESVVPTAVHAETEVHETAPRAYPGLCEVGDGWRVQAVPFHCSATVPSGLRELSTLTPTAVHAVADVHDTPVRKLICAPAGAGIGWMLQLVPPHLSAMTCRALLFPTAVHAFGEVHETAFRNAPGLPEVGVGWMLQLVPSQRSATVPPSGLLKMPSPEFRSSFDLIGTQTCS